MRNVSVAASAGVHVLFALACAGDLFAQGRGGGTRGIAVIMRAEGGATVAGIFQGTRERAAALTAGSFQFDAPHPDVFVLRPDEQWTVHDNRSRRRRGLAIVARLDDGSLAPAVFTGPLELAQRMSESWARQRGIDTPTAPVILELPAKYSRVRVIEPGSTVRSVRRRDPVPQH